ncbi:Dimethyladenosine transferase [Grifola frondosa]|uniref:rRNA adenine N(6)-methyltransferase n=1 Tax=Grifola frondosa TaxID=5627 RepID=A0A1C7MD79_GRIFR|nr:Dimethyladenosine transferase [Grifola frondosa]
MIDMATCNACTMPRATSDRFSRAHQPSAKSTSSTGNAGSSSGARNPIFNTERFGQHILKNPQTAQSIVDTVRYCALPPLKQLAVDAREKAKHVTAVEMDPRMAAELTKRVQGKPEQRKLEIIIGDFVKATLPYFDREFAMRLVAQPSTALWSRLSANVQLYAKVDLVMHVNKNNFRPPPKVESSVVRLVPRDPPPPVEFGEFDGLGRIIFTRRNKTVHANFMAKGVLDMLENNWKTWASVNNVIIEDDVNFKKKVEQVLNETGFTESRAAKMDVDDLLRLLSAFHDAGIHFA